MSESLYTIAVYHYDHEAKRMVRSVVNPEWRMPFGMADKEAARLNGYPLPPNREDQRRYTAINVKEIPQPEPVANGSRVGAHTTSTKGDQRGK